ncbi:protocadherin Fat 4 isoform X1 [Nematostella vectensis]|uniref:protocadherin Fat 4 isoform X1 n=1 Tax=Nematostella vectensis TaxID=45351 RepID=UPI0020773BFC|nr:protocadherin Fat 4 isoform X1 [Nematostella vectensis]
MARIWRFGLATRNIKDQLWMRFVLVLYIHALGFHASSATSEVRTFYIPEGSPTGTEVGRIPVRVQSILLASGIPADLEYNVGVITTKTVLDREKVSAYNLTIVEFSTPPKSYTVLVYVQDLNDNSPSFVRGTSAKLVVFENDKDFRQKLIAVDSDFGSNSTQSYTIVSGNVGNVFELITKRNTDGDLYADLVVNASSIGVDRERLDSYVLNISASDGGNPANHGFLRLSITVEDTNDNKPEFSNVSYSGTIPENIDVGTSIFQVSASDKDIGTNAEIQYSIETHSDPQAIFGIHPTTGVIVNNVRLDYEAKRSYLIVVKAEDKGSSHQLSSSAIVRIEVLDVNDNNPVIHVSYTLGGSYQVTENAAIGTQVARVSVSDADSGKNGEVNVTLEGGDGYFSMKFDVLNDESIIAVGQSLDRETHDHFFLKAVCIDKGDPPRTTEKSFRINVGDVNDCAPKFDQHTYERRVWENATVNTLVARVNAVDQDFGSNSELVYTIANTTESRSYLHWFAIDPSSGMITTATDLDREQIPQVVLTVLVHDRGSPPLSDNCSVIVNLTDSNDNDPYFNQSSYNASLFENSPSGSPVVQLLAQDPDIGENSLILYSILTPNTPFFVDPRKGLVTNSRTLDHEVQSSYTFQVAATDGGGRSCNATVHVSLTDLNDNQPVFDPSSYSVEYFENTRIGQSICQLKAIDRDSPKFAITRFIIEQGNADEVFSVDGSGLITLAKLLDRETQDNYLLTVKAVDGGGQDSVNKAIVNITVLDVNDEPPIFSKAEYNFTIQEHSQALSVIGHVHAISRDKGTNAEVVYSISKGNTDNIVLINSTGTLYLQSEIDHEKIPSLYLTVQAKDKGTPPLFGYAHVTITVIDINDHSPQFNSSSILVRLPEDTPIGHTFYTVSAFDADSGVLGRVSFSLLSNPGTLFNLDSNTGALSLTKLIDYGNSARSYTLPVQAQDGGSPPRSSTAMLELKVVDVNDYSPVFGNWSYTTHVLESTPPDSNIIEVVATDVDSGENGRISYAFDSKVDTSKFGLRNGGKIFIKSKLDREDIEEYNLKVIATDHGTPRRSSSADVKVIVDDVNDNNPHFQQASYAFFVKENEPVATYLGAVSASDSDEGSNGHVTYRFDTQVAQFIVDKQTGKITTSQVLDREAKASYVFSIVATDGGSSPRVDKTQVTVIVRDVNDCSPKFSKNKYSVTVNEDLPVGSSLLTLIATDDDQQGPNSDITYMIVAGPKAFSLNQVTGVLTLVSPLDRKVTHRHILHVVASDKGENQSLETITYIEINVLDVNDNYPVFINETTFKTVPEKLPIGSVVAAVLAVDSDQGDNGKVRYKIVNGNTDGTFKINETTGVISTLRALDFEVTNRYVLRVSATDMGQKQQKTSYQLVTIYVEDANDNRPTFDKNPIITWIYENVPINTNVTTIKAHDDDSGLNSRIWYTIDSQSPRAHFKINSETGLIQTTHPIDREEISEYSLKVRATDQAFTEQDRLYSTATLKIIIQDLNDNAPKFVSRNLTYVMEDEPFNFQVTSITALDPDTGQGGNVEYRIVSPDTGKFSLDLKTGVLKLIGSLDYEDVPQYTLHISATDLGSPPLTSYQLFNVVVVDVNDNPPEFTRDLFIGTVSENEPTGTSVVKVTAYDRDSGSNAELTYSIPSGVEMDKFSIDKHSGLIVTNSILDREKKDTYFLTVHATGVSYPFRVSSTSVRINVMDRNDNPPKFISPVVTLKVPENSPARLIYTLTVQDLDYGNNTKVLYSIMSGNTDGAFTIGTSTGELSTTTKLDRETKAFYQLSVQAKDITPPYYTAFANITIFIEDQNDNPPVFQQSLYSSTISELTPPGTSILNLTASDKDSGSNGNIVYTLSNDTYGVYSIDSRTGIVYSAARFETSIKQEYNFFCIAKDQGQDPKMAIVPVRIKIEDKNNHAPQFTKTPYEVHIFPNTSASALVTMVTATDADTDKSTNGKVTYRLDDSKNSTSLFVVESNTGSVRTSAGFSNPPQGRHALYIIAEDHGSPPLRGYGIVQIVIGNIQDDPPRFLNQTPARVSIPENSKVGSYITTVRARASSDAQVTYSIISGNKGRAFYVDPFTGVISVASADALDYESTKNFRLHLVATPQGWVSLNGYMILDINVIDRNDNFPAFHPSNMLAQIAEDTGAFKPRFVVKVTATDVDSGTNGKVTYSIWTGNEAGVFTIDSTTGEITTAKLLDRETTASFDLVIRGTDSGIPPKSTNCQVKVVVTDLNDNPPLFDPLSEVNIREDTRTGAVVTSVVATDTDKESRLTYTLKSASTPGMFSVGRFNGAVSLLKRLDYEKTNKYSLNIAVSDGLHSAEKTLTINVLDTNDNTPKFLNSSYQVTLSKTIPAGRAILRVSATDQDSGSNAQIKYSFPITNSDQIDYKIDADTGVISARRTIDVRIRDSFIQIPVQAMDQGVPPQRALVYVRIIITREPKFELPSYFGKVPENAMMGTSVLTVRVTDNAAGLPLGRISYNIENSNYFRIGQRSGVISVNKPLDYETKRRFLLVVSAIDDTAPSKPVRVPVYINVSDVNDEKPVFGQSGYMAQWSEGIPVGTIVVNVSAADKDSGANGRVWFAIQSGDDKGSFAIDRKTGVIRTQRALDHETIKTHHVSVRATDEGSPPMHTDVSVTIRVLDLNDNPPVFRVPGPNDVQVLENLPLNSRLYEINATDRDSGANARLSFTVIGGTGQGLFLIDKFSGWLTTNITFDYENTAVYQYSLTIKATDAGNPPLSSNITIIVNVADEDEYDPSFNRMDYKFDVPGNAKIGDFVGQVTATDRDSGDQGRVFFVFYNPTSNALKMNATTGIISVNRTLNDGSSLETRARRSLDELLIGFEIGSSRSRMRRSAESQELRYTIRAYSGKIGSERFADVPASVLVDFTCPGCMVPTTGAREGDPITGTALALIVGLAVLAGVILLAFVVVLLFIYSHRKKRRTRQNPPLRFDGSFDEITVHPRTTGNANYVSAESISLRAFPAEYSPLSRNTDSNSTPSGTDASDAPGSSGSASSGRGSSEGDFDEQPVAIVNADIGSFHSDNNAKTIVADSGIQQDDDDQISQLTLSDGSGILHVDTLNGSESKSDKTDKILARLEFQSVESMHVFGEEGGGEADGGHDVGNLLYAKLAEADADDESIVDGPRSYIDEGHDHPSYGGSLSSIIGSQEELTGSYNWDYLLDWGPQFQPLAEVFLEIGRMKDEGGDKKEVTRNGSIPSSSRLRPNLSGIATVDMLSSMSSLPRSPVSPPSTQYSSPAFSPNFTPAITPLITRSPSVSPLDTGNVSPAYASRGVTPNGSRPTSTHIVKLQNEDDAYSELSHSPSISDNESNAEIHV